MGIKLQGKVAVITGSDSGIGQATAVAFAHEGADVVVDYLIDDEGAEETRRRVESAGRRAIVVNADVRDERQVEEMFDRALREFGHVDILVNNAGVDASGKKVADLDTGTWDNAIKTNLYGYFFCARRFMREREKASGGGGKCINITSVHDKFPRSGAADYDCSKGGELMLMRTLALEGAPYHINVNAIAPGWVATPFNKPDLEDPEVYEADAKTVPWRRIEQPEEVAKVAVFLASDDADYVTGAEWTIDGGLSVNEAQGA
ncbi:MAG: glucose 1-dehydrogenase [Coriobacteriia bacterium]|nr:glucose 1-dehydrogenase [Coriobacteriia bacterium]